MCKPAFICAFLAFTLSACMVHAQAPPLRAEPQAATLEEEVLDEELAPAAIQLDTKQLSPLMRVLYQATRETKEPDILNRLTEAKNLIQSGAEFKTTDNQGRTPLHWVVFGSSYSNKPKVLVLYEELATRLIEKGVEVNRQDVFHNTALDYLLYSPNFEIQTLLLENSATSGFLAASNSFMQEIEDEKNGSMARASTLSSARINLLPGQTIDVQLNVPVYSDRSRTGDPVEGTITYPLCKTGELVECPAGELLLSPGTRVNGTILFAQKAPDKYSRPRLVIDFSNIIHKDGTWSPLYSRVLSVDNARETVRSNAILGIIQPHASTKMSIAVTAIGMTNPIAGYTIRAMQAVYGLSIRREILYPAGTDLQLQVVRPSRLKEKDSWPGYPRLHPDTQLVSIVANAPMRTHTASQKLSDVTNLMFFGTRQQLVSAFDEAGWFTADELSIRSAAKTVKPPSGRLTTRARRSPGCASTIACPTWFFRRH